MEDKIKVTQILDPLTQEQLVTIYNDTHEDEFCSVYRLSRSEIIEKYKDLLTEEQIRILNEYKESKITKKD